MSVDLLCVYCCTNEDHVDEKKERERRGEEERRGEKGREGEGRGGEVQKTDLSCMHTLYTGAQGERRGEERRDEGGPHALSLPTSGPPEVAEEVLTTEAPTLRSSR